MSAYPRLGPGRATGPLTPNGWDRTVIGGEVLPGISRAKAKVKLKHDKKNAAGSDGSSPTYHGLDPQEIDVEVIVWRDDQLEELDRILALILPAPGQKRQPLSFDSPWTRNLQFVTTVKVLGASSLEPAPGYGVSGRKMNITCQHVFASTGAGKKATVTDPENARAKAAEDQRRRGNPLAPNPPPDDQPAIWQAPSFFLGDVPGL